jgi:hypothetical protein
MLSLVESLELLLLLVPVMVSCRSLMLLPLIK